METTGERGDIPSQQCSNCECSLARCWCLDCNEALCDECVSAHRRVTLTRSHRLLNQPSDDSGFVSPTKFCKLHSSEPLKLFCLTCVQLTCRDCQLESHKNHSFSFVNEASENLKKQLDTYRQLLGQKMEESTRSLRDMETRLKFLACCELFQTVDLQRVFKMLVQFLKRRIDCLLKEVKKVYKAEEEMIKDRMLKVKQLQESHRSMSGAIQKAWNTTDLLVLVNCTEQVKPQLMDLVRQDLSPPPNMTNVSIHTDSKFVEDLLTFGKVQELWIPFSVSEHLTKEMEKLSDLSLSSFPPTITPPSTSSQLLSSCTTNSNSVLIPVSSKTNSITSSSSSSIQSGFSSKTGPQTMTSTDAIQPVQVSHSTSHHSCPPLSSSSNLLSSNLTVSNPDTRENPVSLVASVSPFTTKSPPSTSPSSSALTSDFPSLSQTLNICDPTRTTAGHHSVSAFPSTLTSLVPPISSLSSPKDLLTGTTMSAAINTVLHRSSLISPPSQATKGPETSESNVTTTKCPASLGKINILSRSQLESDTSMFYKFRYKNRAPRTVKTSPIRCLKPKGKVDATTSSPLQMVTSSFSFTTSVTSSTSCPPSIQQVLPQAAPPIAQTENIQPTSSTLPPSAKPRTYTLMPVQSSNQQAMALTTTQTSVSSSSSFQSSSSTPPVGVEHHVPFSKNTNSGQKVLVLKRQSVHGQTQSSLVLLTDPQSPAPPSLFSDSSSLHPSFSSFPFALPQTLSFMGQPLTSNLPPVAGPNRVQSLQLLNQNLVPSQNQPALVQLNNTENAYLVSGFNLNPISMSPQFPMLQNNSLCNISTVQDSSAHSWVIPVSLGLQVSPSNATENISPVTQFCSTSSNQQSLTNPSCTGSDSQVFSHENRTSDTGPSLRNGQQQNLESKIVVGSSYSVQDPKMYQESEMDKQPTSVSGPATVEFRETRPAEKLSSSETPQIKETATISEETKHAGEMLSSKLYQVTQNIINSEEIHLIVGPISPASPDSKLTISVEEMEPAGKQSSSKAHVVEPVTTASEKNTFFDRLMSSDDELTIVSPVEAKPAGSCSSPGIDGVERTLVRSEDIKPFGQFSPSGESDPSGKQPPPDGCEDEYIGTESDKSKVVGSSFSPISSDDESLALSEDEDSPLILPLSETSDSENEATKTSRQQDFSQPQWQPKVSLARLPVHLSPKATLLPRFYSVLQDGKEEIYHHESVINMPDDASNNGSNEDFTDLPSSPGSPLSVEIISCAACSSPNASKICSDCGRGYHKDCHIPPVGPDIWSEWICSLCQDLTDPSDPYSSDRSQSPQSTRLSLQNQRRCETLLLHLKVEGCRKFSESDFWTNLMLISERLTHRRPPPYQSAAQLVSDLWIIFQDVSQDDALSNLEQSFQKKLVELLGSELHPSLLKALDTNIPCDDGSTSATNSNNCEEENFPPSSQLKDLKKKLRAFLDLNAPSAKRAKNN